MAKQEKSIKVGEVFQFRLRVSVLAVFKIHIGVNLESNGQDEQKMACRTELNKHQV